MSGGSSGHSQRWERGAQPQPVSDSAPTEESNSLEEEGEWRTVQKGGRLHQKRRQRASESTGMRARGQVVRDRQQDDDDDDTRAVSASGNAWHGRSTHPQQQAQQRQSSGKEPHQFRPGSSEFGGRGFSRGGGGRGGWGTRDGENNSTRGDFRGGGSSIDGGYRGGGGRGGCGGWGTRDGEDNSTRGDFRAGGSIGGGYRGGGGRGGHGGWGTPGGEADSTRGDFRAGGSIDGGYRGRGGIAEHRGRGDGRGRGRGGGRDFNGGLRGGFHRGGARGRGEGRMTSERSVGRQNQSWNFWTLLCGPVTSQIVFTDYKGFCNERARSFRDKGWIQVPLFQPATDEEVCQNFREKLQSVATSLAECEELSSDKCQLQVHLRVGDLYFVHRSYRFDSRPGPQLGDFSDLLEETKFQAASLKLDRFFNADEEYYKPRRSITSTFVTEKAVENHATLEVFLSMRDFKEVNGREEKTLLTTTLNGQQNKFELYYSLEDLMMKNINLITNKWNLNIVTAKGTNYQGSFREVADFRLQFDASFVSDTDAKVNESLANEEFQKEDLQQLFERIGEAPPPLPATSAGDNGASELWAGSERHYRLKLPHLAEKLDYIREQHNRTFVRHHDRWPFMVMLRQFKFYKLANPVAAVFAPMPSVELRVSAELDCPLDREVLDQPEFVSYMWECCQLMQDLVAASLDD